MRDQCTIIKTCGKTTVVLSTHRNANATAFASIIVEDVWGVRFEADAKSQGPSSGGFNKATQAMERLASKLRLDRDPLLANRPESFANAVAALSEQHRKAGTKAPWLV